MPILATSALQDDLADYYLEIRHKVSQQPIGSITVDRTTGEWLMWRQGRHSCEQCKRLGEAISKLVAIYRKKEAEV